MRAIPGVDDEVAIVCHAKDIDLLKDEALKLRLTGSARQQYHPEADPDRPNTNCHDGTRTLKRSFYKPAILVFTEYREVCVRI